MKTRLNGGHIGIAIMCGLLTLSYRGLPDHMGSSAHWVALFGLGFLIWLYARRLKSSPVDEDFDLDLLIRHSVSGVYR